MRSIFAKLKKAEDLDHIQETLARRQGKIFIIKCYHVLLTTVIPFNELHVPGTYSPIFLLPEVT